MQLANGRQVINKQYKNHWSKLCNNGFLMGVPSRPISVSINYAAMLLISNPMIYSDHVVYTMQLRNCFVNFYTDAVRKRFPDINDKQLNNRIGEVLARSGDREQGRKNRSSAGEAGLPTGRSLNLQPENGATLTAASPEHATV